MPKPWSLKEMLQPQYFYQYQPYLGFVPVDNVFEGPIFSHFWGNRSYFATQVVSHGLEFQFNPSLAIVLNTRPKCPCSTHCRLPHTAKANWPRARPISNWHKVLQTTKYSGPSRQLRSFCSKALPETYCRITIFNLHLAPWWKRLARGNEKPSLCTNCRPFLAVQSSE